MESNSIFSQLSFDLIREILLFDSRIVIRKNINNIKLVWIHKIPKEDLRFKLYSKIPKIQEQCPNSLSVTINYLNKKYILRHYLRPSNIWEYSYATFERDQHTNITKIIPSSMICIPKYWEDIY